MEITPELTALLEDLLPVGGGKPPQEMTGWVRPCGNFRKAKARYANGQVLEIFFDQRGQVSSCKASFSTNFSFAAARETVCGTQETVIVDEAANFSRDTVADSDGDDGA